MVGERESAPYALYFSTVGPCKICAGKHVSIKSNSLLIVESVYKQWTNKRRLAQRLVLMPVHFLRSSSKKFRAPREYSSSSSKLRQRIFRLSGIDEERKAFEAHYERYRRGWCLAVRVVTFSMQMISGRIVQKRDEDLPQEAEEGILYELMCKEIRLAASRSDTRTRTDRKERRQKGFAAQIDV